MGFRYKKSINLGGGFRINLSQSGIGYSWGVKGYRVTKTAKGAIRTTASIPGTGISYVHEFGPSKTRSSCRGASSGQSPDSATDCNQYNTQNIVNNVATEMVSDGLETILASANKALKLERIAVIGFLLALILAFAEPIFFALAAAFAAMFLFVRTRGIIDLDYDIESDQQSIVGSRINPMIKVAECAKTWRITQTSKVINLKYSGGASNIVNRAACTATTSAPFPFRTNVKVASFVSNNETLLFLPDKLFIIQGSKIGALNYCDILRSSHTTSFVESSPAPKDTQIIGQTWRYVNKSGSPDKRFKGNRQLPICLYGEFELTSASGLNIVIMCSNPDVVLPQESQ